MQLWICEECGQENEPEHEECIHCARRPLDDHFDISAIVANACRQHELDTEGGNAYGY
jgi:hypothetical protein